MPRFPQNLLNEYVMLIRNRNNAAEMVDQVQSTINQQTGLLNNFFHSANPKYKAQWEKRQADLPVEQRITFMAYMARDVANARARIEQARADKPEAQKYLADCESALTRFTTAHPEIAQLSLDSALELISVDPSADTTVTEALADAAASELDNTTATEAVATRNS